EPHGDLTRAVHLREVAELVAPHRAARRREHHIERLPAFLVLRQGHDGGDALVRFERQQVDERLAARLRGGERQSPYLFLVDLSGRRAAPADAWRRRTAWRRNPRPASPSPRAPFRRAFARGRS